MISYSRTDKDFVDRLQDDLMGLGFPTWMDVRDIPGGTKWDREIHDAIFGAQVILVVLSPKAVTSKWVRKEYTYALRQGKVVIPIQYYPCDIPAALASIQAVDFRPSFANAEVYYTQQLSRLAELIKGYASLDTAKVVATRGSSRLLNVALGIISVLSAIMGGIAGYAKGALLPIAVQPYSHTQVTAAFAMVLLCVLALAFRRARRSSGDVRIYLKDRERFLIKINTRYTNWLKPPFEGALLLALNLSEDAQAVVHPTLASQSSFDEQSYPLPAGTHITNTFLSAEGQLLILGEPGGGKSTLLYQLAQDLAARARDDGTIPIPVVFDLASWAPTHKPLGDWMIDQLIQTWQVPAHIARAWVSQREILPMLDGLDEVRERDRDACVDAINLFQRKHGLDSMAVCCRTQQYHDLSERLDMRKAVVAQPLTSDQIDTYLAAGKEKLIALCELARVDREIRELVSTPLLLMVLSLAYYNTAPDVIPRLADDKAAWVRVIFHDYLQRMLAHRTDGQRLLRATTRRSARRGNSDYSVALTTYYLAWLAHQMRSHDVMECNLERMQPDWLTGYDTRARYTTVVDTAAVIIGGVIGGAVGWLLSGILPRWLFLFDKLAEASAVNAFSAKLILALFIIGPLLMAHMYLVGVVKEENVGNVWIKEWLIATLYLSGFLALCFVPLSELLTRLAVVIFFASLSAGFRLIWINLNSYHIETVDHLNWTWEDMNDDVRLATWVALIVTFCFGFPTLLGFGITSGLHVIIATLVTTFFVGILLLRLLRVLSSPQVDARDFRNVDEGYRRSAMSGLKVFVIYFLVVGTVFVAATSLLGDLATALYIGLASAIGIGGMAGVAGGWGADIKLWALRRQLRREGAIPRHYVQFLDYAADHVMLQRVGGGYRFIHGLLQDYFADQWFEASKGPSA